MCEVWWSREESETRGESRETRLTVGVQCQGDPVKRHETLGDMEPFQREPSCLYTALFGGHVSASHDWTLMTACVSHDLRQLSLPLLGTSSRNIGIWRLKGIRKNGGCTLYSALFSELSAPYRRGSSETKVYGHFLVPSGRQSSGTRRVLVERSGQDDNKGLGDSEWWPTG